MFGGTFEFGERGDGGACGVGLLVVDLEKDCLVALLAHTGRKYDMVTVRFDTTAWSARAVQALHFVNRDTTTAP